MIQKQKISTTIVAPVYKERKDRRFDIPMFRLESRLREWNIVSVGYFPLAEQDFVKEGLTAQPRFVSINSTRTDIAFEVQGGINSFLMAAPNDNQMRCGTCQGKYEQCPGHLGQIDLGDAKMFHPLLINNARHVLGCICWEAFNRTRADTHPDIHLVRTHETIMKTDAFQTTTGIERLELISQIGYCEHCQSPNYDYRAEIKKGESQQIKDGIKIVKKTEKYRVLKRSKMKVKGQEKQVEYFTEKETYDFLLAFDKSPDRLEMIVDMGIDPSVMLNGIIISHVAVVPPNFRHRISRGSEQTQIKTSMTDDYSFILKKTGEIQSAGSRLELQKITGAIANRVTNMINVSLIVDTLRGKAGLIRRDLNAARCNFSGRTVVTLDSWLDPDQVGIPDVIARKWSVREVVTADNLKEFGDLVREGRITSIFRRGTPTTRFQIPLSKSKFTVLHVGDFVERPFKTGDVVLLNRQPTIHSRGIMGYRAVIGPWRAFRLNMPGTTPYHADFDGDEMNAHVPQVEEAIAQARGSGNIKNLMLDPHTGGNMIGLVFELLDAASRLTDGTRSVSKEEFDYLMMIVFGRSSPEFQEMIDRGARAGVLSGKEDRMPGRILFSTLLDPTFNHVSGDVVISNGVLLQGKVRNTHIGVPGTIVTSIALERGTEEAVKFIDRGNRLLLAWQDLDPTTCGSDDYLNGIKSANNPSDPSNQIREGITKHLYETIDAVKQLTPRVIFSIERKMMQRAIYSRWGTRPVQSVKEANDFLEEILLGISDRVLTGTVPVEKIEYVLGLIKQVVGKVLVDELEEIPSIIKVKVFDVIDNKNERDWVETKIRPLTDALGDYSAKQLKNLPSESYLKMTKEAGSKGADSYTKMDLFIGQQLLRGHILPVSGAEKRCLIYSPDSIDPESRGFLKESFTDGSSPLGCFFLHVTGRETNIATAEETPKVGYVHRRVTMACQDTMVGISGDLISGKKRILSTLYGGDGFDPSRMEKEGVHQFTFLNIGNLANRFNASAGYC